jgi:molybdate transport system substrate-binding protein
MSRALVALILLLAGCRADPAPRALTVFAASSLTEAFDDLAGRFEAAHPEVDVRVSYAGSQVLATQLEHGAAADVFASADVEHIDALVRSGVVTERAPFASNELVAVFPAASRGPRALAELPEAERIVLGDARVPVGRYTERFLARADGVFGAGYREAVLRHVVSREPNVRLVLGKVTLGEADAALVYRTDARAAGDAVRVVELPPEASVRAELFAGPLRRAASPELARAFLALLHGPEGRRALSSRGFGPVVTADPAGAPLREAR